MSLERLAAFLSTSGANSPAGNRRKGTPEQVKRLAQMMQRAETLMKTFDVNRPQSEPDLEPRVPQEFNRSQSVPVTEMSKGEANCIDSSDVGLRSPVVSETLAKFIRNFDQFSVGGSRTSSSSCSGNGQEAVRSSDNERAATPAQGRVSPFISPEDAQLQSLENMEFQIYGGTEFELRNQYPVLTAMEAVIERNETDLFVKGESGQAGTLEIMRNIRGDFYARNNDIIKDLIEDDGLWGNIPREMRDDFAASLITHLIIGDATEGDWGILEHHLLEINEALKSSYSRRLNAAYDEWIAASEEFFGQAEIRPVYGEIVAGIEASALPSGLSVQQNAAAGCEIARQALYDVAREKVEPAMREVLSEVYAEELRAVDSVNPGYMEVMSRVFGEAREALGNENASFEELRTKIYEDNLPRFRAKYVQRILDHYADAQKSYKVPYYASKDTLVRKLFPKSFKVDEGVAMLRASVSNDGLMKKELAASVFDTIVAEMEALRSEYLDRESFCETEALRKGVIELKRVVKARMQFCEAAHIQGMTAIPEGMKQEAIEAIRVEMAGIQKKLISFVDQLSNTLVREGIESEEEYQRSIRKIELDATELKMAAYTKLHKDIAMVASDQDKAINARLAAVTESCNRFWTVSDGSAETERVTINFMESSIRLGDAASSRNGWETMFKLLEVNREFRVQLVAKTFSKGAKGHMTAFSGAVSPKGEELTVDPKEIKKPVMPLPWYFDESGKPFSLRTRHRTREVFTK